MFVALRYCSPVAEDVQVPDVGHFTDLANEIVNKHGVVYVAR
jgi:hypothetical protein